MSLPVPAILMLVSTFGVLLSAAPTSRVAGRLLQLGAVSEAVSSIIARRRVTQATPYLLSGIGVLAGLAIGGILSGLFGWQGWLVGALAVVAAVAIPQTIFVNGWERRFVDQVNADTLMVTRMVFMLSGVGKKPVDEALRTFSRSWANRSALADLMAGCPATESLVAFLANLDIPGDAYTSLVMVLKQVTEIPESQRRRVLGHRLQMAMLDLKHHRTEMVKQRAQKVLVIGVLLLLPTLMLAVLAPPFVAFMAQVKIF